MPSGFEVIDLLEEDFLVNLSFLASYVGTDYSAQGFEEKFCVASSFVVISSSVCDSWVNDCFTNPKLYKQSETVQALT